MQFRTLLFALALMVPAVASAADSTWAVLDWVRATEQTTHFKKAKAAFDEKVASRKKHFDARKTKLESQVAAIEAKKAMASPDAIQEEERQLLEKRQELAQEFYRSQQELAMFDRKLKQQIMTRLEAVMKQIVDEDGHTFVIDAQKVLFHRRRIDITDKVLQRYEKLFKDKELDLEMPAAPPAGRPAP